MPARRPYIHRRNRQPRPGAIKSPPAGVQILAAVNVGNPTNSTILDLTGPIAASTGANTQFRDYSSAEDSVGILFNAPNPYRVVVIWPTSADRSNNIVGWDDVPTIMNGVQLPILPNQRAVAEG